MINNSSCALVIGLCSHGLAISRSLYRGGIEVHAFETNRQAPGFKTKSAIIHQVKSINDDDLVGELIEFRSNLPNEKQIVLFPTNDNNVRIIAQHIKVISKYYIVSWASSAATVGQLLLKSNIEQRCIDTGLRYPRSVMTGHLESLQESLSTLNSPFIVKPVNPQSGFKALKFQTPQSAAEGLKDYAKDFPVLSQEWIAGADKDLYFCAVYMDKGRPLHSLVGRKLDSYPPALGQTTVAITHNDDILIRLTHRFFAGLEISGPVSLEFKQDQNGDFWVIEPTVGRSDFWLGLCIGAGLDLPLLEYERSSSSRVQPLLTAFPSSTIWFDSERDPMAPIRHIFQWLGFSSSTCKPVFSYFDAQDLPPFYRASLQTTIRLKSALIKKILG